MASRKPSPFLDRQRWDPQPGDAGRKLDVETRAQRLSLGRLPQPGDGEEHSTQLVGYVLFVLFTAEIF